LAVAAGTVSHTGVAGLTLTGGIGYLTRWQGLSCDNLRAARVVTAEGQIVTASATENPDLFWGLRGAGANFGVVTELEFQLHEVNPLANLGLLFWELERAGEALRFGREYLPTLPREMGFIVAGLTAPPAPFVPESSRGVIGIAIIVVSWGSPEAHAAALRPLRARSPRFELVTPMPYTQVQKLIDEAAPWGIRAYDKGIYLDDLSDEAIAILLEHLARKASPMTIMPMFPLDGAFCDTREDGTAFGGRRHRQWLLGITAVAPDRGMFEADRDLVRSCWSALRALSPDGGTYLNFSSDLEDAIARARASYGDAKYERIARVKAQWDPENVFHCNANVPPAPA
jgi:hypothetical protein